MGNSKAIGRRRRVLKRAHDRAQRRFHAAIEAGVIFDETARATRLYVEAERLVDAVMAPEVHRLPSVALEDILTAMGMEAAVRDIAGPALRRRAIAGYDDRADEYQTRGA